MHNLNLPKFTGRGDEYCYLAKYRWPTGEVVCPRCRTTKIIPAARRGFFRCRWCWNNCRNGPFNASAGTALAAYRTQLRMFLYAAYAINLGAEGLSISGLSEKMNVSLMSSYKIVRRLEALNREGMGYILGPFAPQYPYKVKVLNRYNAGGAHEFPYLINA